MCRAAEVRLRGLLFRSVAFVRLYFGSVLFDIVLDGNGHRTFYRNYFAHAKRTIIEMAKQSVFPKESTVMRC